MPLAPDFHTAAMVRAMPEDGNRYEAVHGELLVTPAPGMRHQVIVSRLAYQLTGYVMRHGLGLVLTAPADISWSEDSLVQPDVFVVPADQSSARDWSEIRRLLLVAEVLSPSTARFDRFQKRAYYQRHGVGTTWMVDPQRRVVEAWTPDAEMPAIESRVLTWHPAAATDPLVIRLDELFA